MSLELFLFHRFFTCPKDMILILIIEMTSADVLLAFNIYKVTTKWKIIRNAELSRNVLNPICGKA